MINNISEYLVFSFLVALLQFLRSNTIRVTLRYYWGSRCKLLQLK